MTRQVLIILDRIDPIGGRIEALGGAGRFDGWLDLLSRLHVELTESMWTSSAATADVGDLTDVVGPSRE